MKEKIAYLLELLTVCIPVVSAISVVILSFFGFEYLSFGVLLLMANLPLLVILDEVKTSLED